MDRFGAARVSVELTRHGDPCDDERNAALAALAPRFGVGLVATTGGPAQSYHASGYNRYAFDAFLPPYEQTAALCGMRFLPPLVLYGAHTVGPEVVQRHLSTFSNKLSTYPQWPELASLAPRAEPAVPANDRPTGDAVTAATRGA